MPHDALVIEAVVSCGPEKALSQKPNYYRCNGNWFFRPPASRCKVLTPLFLSVSNLRNLQLQAVNLGPLPSKVLIYKFADLYRLYTRIHTGISIVKLKLYIGPYKVQWQTFDTAESESRVATFARDHMRGFFEHFIDLHSLKSGNVSESVSGVPFGSYAPSMANYTGGSEFPAASLCPQRT